MKFLIFAALIATTGMALASEIRSTAAAEALRCSQELKARSIYGTLDNCVEAAYRGKTDDLVQTLEMFNSAPIRFLDVVNYSGYMLNFTPEQRQNLLNLILEKKHKSISNDSAIGEGFLQFLAVQPQPQTTTACLTKMQTIWEECSNCTIGHRARYTASCYMIETEPALGCVDEFARRGYTSYGIYRNCALINTQDALSCVQNKARKFRLRKIEGKDIRACASLN